MTELQKVRKALISQLDKVQNNTSKETEVDSIVQISNTIIKAHNTELRADELAQENYKILKNEVFKDEESRENT